MLFDRRVKSAACISIRQRADTLKMKEHNSVISTKGNSVDRIFSYLLVLIIIIVLMNFFCLPIVRAQVFSSLDTVERNHSDATPPLYSENTADLGMPDLTVTSLHTENTYDSERQGDGLVVVVQNQGSVAAHHFEVVVKNWYGRTIALWHVSDLKAGASVRLSDEDVGVGIEGRCAIVDPSAAVTESKENNNSFGRFFGIWPPSMSTPVNSDVQITRARVFSFQTAEEAKGLSGVPPVLSPTYARAGDYVVVAALVGISGFDGSSIAQFSSNLTEVLDRHFQRTIPGTESAGRKILEQSDTHTILFATQVIQVSQTAFPLRPEHVSFSAERSDGTVLKKDAGIVSINARGPMATEQSLTINGRVLLYEDLPRGGRVQLEPGDEIVLDATITTIDGHAPEFITADFSSLYPPSLREFTNAVLPTSCQLTDHGVIWARWKYISYDFSPGTPGCSTFFDTLATTNYDLVSAISYLPDVSFTPLSQETVWSPEIPPSTSISEPKALSMGADSITGLPAIVVQPEAFGMSDALITISVSDPATFQNVEVSASVPFDVNPSSIRSYTPIQVYGEGKLMDLAVSPSGKQIVTGSNGGWAVLWDSETGQILRRFSGHHDRVTSVAFSPDGRQIVTGSGDGTAKLWDIEIGQELLTFSGHASSVESVAYSPGGKWIVTGDADGTVTLWDAKTGQSVQTLRGHNSCINSAAFSPDGRWIATGSADTRIHLWEAETGRLAQTLLGHRGSVLCIAFFEDSRRLASSSSDGTAKLWDTSTGQLIQTFSVEAGAPVQAVAVSQINDELVTASSGGVRIWEMETGLMSRLLAPLPSANRVRISPNQTWIVATAEFDPALRLYEYETGNEIRMLRGHNNRLMSIGFSPDGRGILTAGDGGEGVQAQLWDTETGAEIQAFKDCGVVISTDYSSDGRYVLLANDIGDAQLFDVETGQPINNFHPSDSIGNAVSVAISPNNTYVLTGHEGRPGSFGPAKVWDLQTGTEIHTLSGHGGNVKSVAFSPDGNWILTGSDDKTARLWDVANGHEVRIYMGHKKEVVSVAFSPDGRWVLTSSLDGTARLWNFKTAEPVWTFHGDKEHGIRSAAFSPDGRWIVTGSTHGTAKVWDIQTGVVIATFRSHVGSAVWAFFSPDGRRVLTGGVPYPLMAGEGIARLWEVDSPRVLIVAGGGEYKGNALIEQTKALSAYAYSICRTRGYEKEDIRWLSAFDAEQDADGDLVNDVFGSATRQNLRKAITDWARSDLISSGRRLLIYMIDHGFALPRATGGKEVYFRLNENEAVSSLELDSWLDSLTGESTQIDVTLVVDSCYSGIFVQNCLPSPRGKRQVISSTSSDTEAVIMPPPDLTSFSYVFWGAAYMGAKMKEAVRAATGFFQEFSISGQRPQMDDNGDGVFDEHDGFAMGSNRFGRGWGYAGQGSGEFPVFDEIYPSEDTLMTVHRGASVDLTAQVVPGSNPEEIWAVVRLPAPQTISGESILANESIRKVSLVEDPTDTNTWSAKLEDLQEKGVYIVSFTARLKHNRLSRPKITRIKVSEEPNPEETLTIRALLAAGGGSRLRSFSEGMVSYALQVCQKRGYPNDNIRILGRDHPTQQREFLDTLRTLAVPESPEKSLRLFLYLVGDGSPEGVFFFGEDETIAAPELLDTLNDLQASHPTLEVILVVDSPYAGKFVEANADDTSGRRLVIAGTSTKGKGLFIQTLSQLSFSKYFLGNAYRGEDLWTSYDGAYLSLVDGLKQPEPLLDDDGDGRTTKSDGLLAEKWFIGRRGALAGSDAAAVPTLLRSSEFDSPLSGDVTVWVDVLEAAVPDRVWGTVVPKDGGGTSLASTFHEIDLSREGSSWRWSGTIQESSFDAAGEYALVFHALYEQDKLSEPLTVFLPYGEVPLTPSPSQTPTHSPMATPTPTLTPTPSEDVAMDYIVVSQGYGGNTANKLVRTSDLRRITNFPALPSTFAEYLQTTTERSVNTAIADIDGDGITDIVTAVGPGGMGSIAPSILVAWSPFGGKNDGPRVITSKNVFALGAGNALLRNPHGALNVCAGNFVAGELPLVIATQGLGGDNQIRALQYMEVGNKRILDIVGTFQGLTGAAVRGNGSGGTSVSAGDVDGDGLDELIVGQMNGAGSTTLFQIVDLDRVDGRIQVTKRSAPVAGMPEGYQGSGGINLAVGDVDGDGDKEIVVANAGMPDGASGDTALKNFVRVFDVKTDGANSITSVEVMAGTNWIQAFGADANPSGGLDVACGNLDNDRADEILLSTQAMIAVDPDTGEVSVTHPAPNNLVRAFSLEFGEDGTYESATRTLQPFPAFAGDFAPSSGAINISIYPAY